MFMLLSALMGPDTKRCVRSKPATASTPKAIPVCFYRADEQAGLRKADARCAIMTELKKTRLWSSKIQFACVSRINIQ
jgi:hypothetical protein